MKSVVVYPSLVMSFICPLCNASGKITVKKIPAKDFQVSCPKCKEKILIRLNLRICYRKKISINVLFSQFDFDGSWIETYFQGIIKKKKIVDTSYGRKVKKGEIIDISQTGMRIEYVERRILRVYPEEEGNILNFLLILNREDRPFQVMGKIVRFIPNIKTKIFEIGIIFFELNEYQKKEIGFFLM